MAKDLLDVGGFEILQRLGVGARSTIYKAIDQSDGTEIALKRVILRKPEDARIFEQVEAEYKVASKVDHPYIRKCYKLKKIRSLLKVTEMLLSMEYFDGKSLQDGPTLSLVDVLLVFRMVANGLHAMHQNGFVHCDIKPNNILISKAGTIKIIDLGQSCKIGTVKKRIQGTPDYIAPEQVKRKPMGPKTDVFNLGATMYWALSGINVPTMIPKKDAMGRTIHQEKKILHVIRPQVPIAVSKLVMECVEDDPVARPKNMTEVGSKLDVVIHTLLGNKIKNKNNGARTT